MFSSVAPKQCPQCGGDVESWYVHDDYGPSGGTNCLSRCGHKFSSEEIERLEFEDEDD